LVVLSASGTAGATVDPSWTGLLADIRVWVNRLGAAVVLAGAVRFGLGWQSDDADKKTQGLSTIIAGCIVMAMVNLAVTVTASGSTAAAMWGATRDLLALWLPRLGGVVIAVGGILLGLGWKNDDAEGKSRGVQTIISGSIVAALGAAVHIIFV